MKINRLHIHGDNILECENSLKLLSSSLDNSVFKLKSGPAYAPVYRFEYNGDNFEIQLFPGYGRWDFPLAEYIASIGGILREAPDAVITRVENENGKELEYPLLALEFSEALPAGNNAWQRTGRALALAYANIPYLYFADLGGQELDSSRAIKASRFPNPLVPFAYIMLDKSSGSISLPIYLPSSSINQEISETFSSCFSNGESIELVKKILLAEDTQILRSKIEEKVLKVVEILAEQRKKNDILKPEEWKELYAKQSGLERAGWLIQRQMPWNKKIGLKTITNSFKKLITIAKKNNAAAIGSKEMPFCLISPDKRNDFASDIKAIYKNRIGQDFINWLGGGKQPLVCVWIAGFKPRGDDSRPDRGLVPLARMIFGTENIDLLSIIYGPATPGTWKTLQNDMSKLATTNGLWEAIINFSNGLIIDSNTSRKIADVGFLTSNFKSKTEKRPIPAAIDKPEFGEQDIDSVLHLLFSNFSSDEIYECMCNPPGGDWSGINILEPARKMEFRWTSLPRVSGNTTKRPDHLIQITAKKTLLSIESKDIAQRLEEKIGTRLTAYAKTLLKSHPIAVRKLGSGLWEQCKSEKIDKFNLLSAGAFRYKNVDELKTTLLRAYVDMIFGIEFIPETKNTIIHVMANKRGTEYLKDIEKLSQSLKGIVNLQIHQ